MIDVICKNCGCEFSVSNYRGRTAQYCSRTCFAKHRTKYGFEPYTLKQKVCRYCGISFIPETGRRQYCYKEECLKQGIRAYRRRGQGKRKIGRQRVQKAWGYVNNRHAGLRGGRKAEEVAINFLQEHGFSNIMEIWREFPVFPFDVIATKEGKNYAVQVTTRTHSGNRYRKITDALDIVFAILFVKPDLSHAILKIPTGSYSELSLKEVMPNESGNS